MFQNVTSFPFNSHNIPKAKNETYTDNVIEAYPKSRPRRKRERQSLTPDLATRAQMNENRCQDTLNELNSTIDKLLPILGQILLQKLRVL